VSKQHLLEYLKWSPVWGISEVQLASTATIPPTIAARAASVTDNFGNRDNLRAGERRSKRKSERSLILWGRRGTQAATITSVTEVIEVIGY